MTTPEARQAACNCIVEIDGEGEWITRHEPNCAELKLQQLAESYADLVRAKDELELKYRVQLWSSHGHHGYGDDGELQCCECARFGATDYRRDPLEKVESACQMARMVRGTKIINEIERAEAAESLNRELVEALVELHDATTQRWHRTRWKRVLAAYKLAEAAINSATPLAAPSVEQKGSEK